MPEIVSELYVSFNHFLFEVCSLLRVVLSRYLIKGAPCIISVGRTIVLYILSLSLRDKQFDSSKCFPELCSFGS